MSPAHEASRRSGACDVCAQWLVDPFRTLITAQDWQEAVPYIAGTVAILGAPPFLASSTREQACANLFSARTAPAHCACALRLFLCMFLQAALGSGGRARASACLVPLRAAAHEYGHWEAARRHGASTYLPFFVPAGFG